jgi:RNA polymerase sigma-70 factor (ECF subfamily)
MPAFPEHSSGTAPDGGTSLSLLQRLRASDGDAWHRLVRLYGPLVLYWCGRWGVAGADAEDVSQEVFRAVASRLADFRRDRPGDTFRGWLRAITRNQLLIHQRRRGRNPEAAGGSDAQLLINGVPAPLSDQEEDPLTELNGLYRRAVELVRAEFEAKTWEMFWAAAVDGRPVADVAADQAVTPAAVRKAKSRVLHRLKEEVGDLIQ